MTAKKRKPLGSAMEEFVFGSKEATPAPPAAEVVSPAPAPTASLIRETRSTPEAPLPVLTPPQPFASAAEPVPAPSKESSLMSKLQAPDSRSNGQVYGGYVRVPAPQTIDAGSQDGAQESGYCADAVGGWVEGARGVRIIFILMAIAVRASVAIAFSC